MKKVGEVKPDVVHGHGSKGGLYARLPGLLRPGSGPVRAYTPHGGSFNYKPGSLMHRAFMATEKLLTLLAPTFSCSKAPISPGASTRSSAAQPGPRRIVANGISARRIRAGRRPIPTPPISSMSANCAPPKASTRCSTRSRSPARQLGDIPRAVLVGSGPDKDILIARAQQARHRPSHLVSGPDAGARRVQAGRIMVVPSRAESLPYVVLEAAGARVPLVVDQRRGNPGNIRTLSRPPRPERRSGRSVRAHAGDAAPSASRARAAGCRTRQPMSNSISRSARWSIRSWTGYREAMARRAADRGPARDSPTCRRTPEKNHGRIFSKRHAAHRGRAADAGRRAQRTPAKVELLNRLAAEPVKPAYSPVVLAGLVRAAEFILIVLTGALIHHFYVAATSATNRAISS